MSATPINLRANDLRALLKLIDPDTFERECLFDLLQDENEPYVRAWEAARDQRASFADLEELISDLPAGQVLKTGKRLERLREELAKGMEDTPANRVRIASRLEEMSLLGTIINRTRRRVVAEFKVERRPTTVRWPMAQIEREFYEAASDEIANYALINDVNERFLLAQTQRLLASSLPAAYRHWGTRTGNLSLDDEDDEYRYKTLPGPLTETLGAICDDPRVLAALEASDTKFQRLVESLRKIRQDLPDEKVIIFSSFRKTIDYLARRLDDAGFESIELHGGIDLDRQTIVNHFADAPAGTVLLTSEVGGEGLDLQFCRILFNWDLPWNPMRVEQRIGRIDRIGQQSPSIDIINLIAEDTIEERVYERLYERLGIIRSTLGDFEPILGEIIRDIELALVNPELTEEQKVTELDRSVLAAEKRKAIAEELEQEAPGLSIPRWVGTSPYGQVPFQFSAHVEQEDGELEHIEALDLSGHDPREAIAEALAGLPDEGAVVAWNAGFERRCLRLLAEAVPRHRDALLSLAERTVDLLPVAKKNYYHRDQRGSFSIKAVLPTLLPELDYGDLQVADGGDAQLAYIEATDTDCPDERRAELAAGLMAYCERDTLAMVEIYRKLAGA